MTQRIAIFLFALLLGLSGVVYAGEHSGTMSMEEQATVNINTADAAMLAKVLNGVGKSKAEAIIAYRKANGKFRTAEELTAVKGIGPRTVKRNMERIKLD